LKDFRKLKVVNGGRWWSPGASTNPEFVGFVNTWLDDWVGFAQETVFDVNCLVVNDRLVLVNNHNAEVEAFLNFIQLVQLAGISINGKQGVKDLVNFIQFDTNQKFTGLAYLKDLLYAIKHKRQITFIHTNYHTERQNTYTIKPVLLKQYQNRWYIIGVIDNNEFRTFGCDRISDLVIETTTFKAINNKEIKNNFDQIIGLNYSNGKVQKIKLELTPVQAKYVVASPLHSSQYIIEEAEDKTIIALDLIPNYELIQKILMLGDQVKVISPESLKNEVKGMIGSMMDNYKK
jgi:hypothetical protein